MNEGEELFSISPLDVYLRNIKHHVISNIERASDEELSGPLREVTAQYERRARVEPLSLDVDNMTRSQPQETQLDASKLPDAFARGVSPGEGPGPIDATRVIVRVPYAGEPRLWKCQPNVIGPEKPRGNVDSHHVSIPIVLPAADMTPDRVETDVNETVAGLERWIEYTNAEVERHNSMLFPDVGSAVEKRLKALAELRSIDDGLDIPLSDA
jgi:hypothetical protein